MSHDKSCTINRKSVKWKHGKSYGALRDQAPRKKEESSRRGHADENRKKKKSTVINVNPSVV